MFCIYCGKPIPEGGKCNCKDPVITSKQVYMSAQNPVTSPYAPPEYTYNNPTYTYNSPESSYNNSETRSSNEFCNTLRSVTGSAPVLVFAILSCVAFVLDLIAFNINIPLLLTIIGAFLIYSNSRQRNSIIRKSGYTLFSIVTIANLATHCVLSISVIIYLIRTIATGMMDERITHIARIINGGFEHSTIRLTALANVSLCLIVFAFAILVFLYLFTLNCNFVYIRKMISSQNTKGCFRNFPNIIMIIHGVLGFIAAIIIFKEQVLITKLLYDFLSSEMLTLFKMLTTSLKFGLPGTLIVLSVSRIFAGISLCRLNGKLRKIKQI